jgi:hypothetical protein
MQSFCIYLFRQIDFLNITRLHFLSDLHGRDIRQLDLVQISPCTPKVWLIASA